ncbi:hypothetical protein VTJ49DRAFT_1180 [Mycothermus thermophilus]|uniref:Glucan 1, 4-alpha-glucosidase n=1 Tax=Humicola insolens TaxID=85995 RepID=A0ABR3VD79_HUMIN
MASSPQSPPKRPRLSLQIKALANGPSVRTSRCLAAAGVDVTSPTSFNTLSNVYATAVDRSTPVHENPPTAVLGRRPVLKLQTQGVGVASRNANPASATPYLGPYIETPVTAQPVSPAVTNPVCFPSAMTATPPLSAQAQEQGSAQVFTFDGTTPVTAIPPSTQVAQQQQQASNPKRRTTAPASTGVRLPYTHPRSLRSILRNSPLPSTKSPESPRRQSLRLQEKAARRVAYHSPLTQEITTTKYVKSHIDLLAEDSSANTTPVSPASTSSSDDCDSLLDQAMTDAPETRDGGQTPGPFEEMRRRMANMHASTPTALSPTGGGIRKRGSGKRREKKRRWVWTIGQDDEGESCDAETSNPPTAMVAETTRPTPSVPILSVPSPRPRTRLQQAMARAVAEAAQMQAASAAPQVQVPVLPVPVPPTRRQQAQPQPQPKQSDEPQPSIEAHEEAQPQPSIEPHEQPQPQLQSQPKQKQPKQHHLQHLREATPIPASLLPSRDSTPHPRLRDVTPDSSASGPTYPAAPSAAGDGGVEATEMAITTPTNPTAINTTPPMSTTEPAPPPPPPPHTPSMASTTSTVSSVQSIDGDTDDNEDVEMSDACSLTRRGGTVETAISGGWGSQWMSVLSDIIKMGVTRM